ncbi:uncharacterized protein ATC70_002522 [Mucor velutinosus]|uniref:histidine kinase n=1 Tax=Mucor velutinosus TaxID=708070 RepID=A0AAN7DFG0_9FUNG|nr:hypothetical protein ATC70_002522 [Mucor velutinosus]
MNSDTSSSATSQYHAQLYSGQKQLQKRHQLQQEQKKQLSLPPQHPAKPTSLNYKVLSFDAPNLYHTSLKLTTEIDIHAWWASLVKIFSGTSFHATRIALSIPQDPNDPYAGPWGLKAVYNKTGSISREPDRVDTNSNEDLYSGTDDTREDETQFDYFLHSHSVHETCPRHVPWCFDRLQPFESEPEPLINNPSVSRILKRNAPVVLSREYRRRSSNRQFGTEDLGLEIFKRALMEGDKSRLKSNWSLPIITTPCFSKDESSEILVDGSNIENDDNSSSQHDSNSHNEHSSSANTPSANATSTFLQDFDEYEQQQPSPWSQSPAPSPAIMDPEINPFFQSPPDIDDEAFNPVSPESYDNPSIPFPPPISNVHSIIHVPLFHPSDVIEPTHPNTNSINTTTTTTPNATLFNSTSTTNTHANHRSQQSHPTPIAILSFLAPIVPYPPVLLSSIASLSPFIAASFTNANENAQYRKQGQFYNNRRSNKQSSSDANRPKNYRRRSARSQKKQESHSEDSDSNNEADYDDFYKRQQQMADSTTTTPTAAYNHDKRPDHLGSMSNFTRSSLETVTEPFGTPSAPCTPNHLQEREQPQHITTTTNTTTTTDFSSPSSYDSTFSAHADVLHKGGLLLDGNDEQAAHHDIMVPPASQQRKRSSQTSIATTESTCSTAISKERRQSSSNRSFKALSPSSIAVMEGWGAVSPTTGLPISASIPPHNMCSDKNCLKHQKIKVKNDSFLDTEDEDEGDDDDDDEIFAKTTETDDSYMHQHDLDDNDSIDDISASLSTSINNLSSIPAQHATKPKSVVYRQRKKARRRSRYKRQNSNGSRKQYDDDGFHYHQTRSTSHHHRNTGVDRFLVAPKSSLLRLIIDGIPIHVFTCSTASGQVTWVNNRMLQYTGRSLKDHLGPKWLSHMHPDDQPECKKAWELAYEQGNGFAGEYRLKRFDGVYRCFLWRIVPLRDLKGKIMHWFGTCTDVHDQHVAKESSLRQVEIESNERKYRLLAEAIPQIVFTFSPGAGLTYTNGKWSQYAGKSFEQTMGLGFMSGVHPEDRAKLQLPDLPALPNRAGVSWQSEIRLLSAHEEYRWFLVKCVSVDELETGDVRWFGTCTDINDHKLLEKKLKEAHDAAQRSTESKTRFLSNMSHEIRTPLIGITGMLNFLLDTELTAEQMDYVHTIQQSAESLLVVINDILDLSKVEAGMMKLEWEPFSLVTMIEDANELLSTLAIQKDLELSFWVDDDVPDVVVGDRVRLRQVMLNLIGNAIKFTAEGEVFTKCTVQRCDKDESELTLLFEVVDTGAGFDAMEESVMFKPFSQVDSSSTRKHGGSGLGLVISRQLIELHGGVMKCRSQKGKGSTFFFTVKFGIPTSQTKPLPQTPQNDSNHDPFFRSNGYGNNNTAQAIVESSADERNLSPLPFVNKNSTQDKQQHISTIMASSSDKQSESSPADILQDVLMTKAASMQLKPPPIRNTNMASTTAVAAVAAAATAATNIGNKVMLNALPPLSGVSSTLLENSAAINSKSNNTPTLSLIATDNANNQLKPCEPRIPTIGTGPGSLSTSPVIQPPRTPTSASPLRALIVSQWEHSRESMEKHVKSILGSSISNDCGINSNIKHYQVDTLTNQIEATEWLTDPHTPAYDYIMINLSSEQQILSLTRAICGSLQQQKANVLVVTTPMQRSLITESAKGREDQVIPHTCGFVFKPLKRTKLRWYFGVRQQEIKHGIQLDGTYGPNSSAVSTPDTPHRRAASQKEIFRRMATDVGGKGFRVLLVEDNLVNQKVLTRYLTRVGLNVDIAVHGGECIELFHKHPKDYYCLILCDLFMPVKDGYETTREIREWEKQHLAPNEKPKPIVALSANVMSDVANKCLECGFSTYISKPVNFAILSDVIRGYLLD